MSVNLTRIPFSSLAYIHIFNLVNVVSSLAICNDHEISKWMIRKVKKLKYGSMRQRTCDTHSVTVWSRSTADYKILCFLLTVNGLGACVCPGIHR